MGLQAHSGCLRAANAGVIIICLVLFATQFRIIMTYYSQRKTNTAISYESHTLMELPHITICPQVPQKGNKTMHLEEDYQSNSFGLSDYLNMVGVGWKGFFVFYCTLFVGTNHQYRCWSSLAIQRNQASTTGQMLHIQLCQTCRKA